MKIRRLEIAVVALLLAVAAGFAVWLYRPKEGETIAVISVDGAEWMRLDLENEPDRLFSIEAETGKPVSFEIKDHRIRFCEVDCPDHICEKAGWCDSPGDRAVCMPNRTALICYARDEVGGG